MKVIIKYKTETGRNSKYRAGSLQDLPEEEAQALIKSGHAVPYMGGGRAIERETRVATPKEPAKPVLNNKRALQAAKAKRLAEEAKETSEEPKESKEPKVVKSEESEDGAKKDNGAKRKSSK